MLKIINIKKINIFIIFISNISNYIEHILQFQFHIHTYTRARARTRTHTKELENLKD